MNDTINLFGQQVPIALVLVFLQNWLKQQRWFPLLTYQSTRMNHLFSIAATGLATIGIGFTFNHDAHTLTITGLQMSTIAAGVWHWLGQYAVTKGIYTGLQSQLNPPAAQQTIPVVQSETAVSAPPSSTPISAYEVK